jgi:hypothetical protein
MSYSIVQEIVSETVAPAPITYQATGAIVSQGATTIPTGTSQLLTQKSDLTQYLPAPLTISSITWSSGTALVTAGATIPGRTAGDVFTTTIAGVTPAGYNGLVRATVTGANTLTYALLSNPGAQTVAGTYTVPGVGELVAQMNTFYAQGSQQSVYVLELGAGDQTTGPAALGTWDATNPDIFYSYLVPKGWDASAGLTALMASYQALNAQKYFFITSKVSTYAAAYSALQKCGYVLIEAPGTPLTEFSCAAPFQRSLAYAPSTTNRMTQFRYAFLFGVTPYPTFSNGTLLTTLQNAKVNVIGTGAEGGISTAVNWWGTMLDGNDFSVWYEIDWIQLQCDQAVANAVINGSNDPLNPLYYNQPGINQLQDVTVQTVQNAITFGLANGTSARAAMDGPVFSNALATGQFLDQDVVNAVPFITYIQENPANYEAGLYGGLSVVFIPQKGFSKVIFNINVNFNPGAA